MPRFFAENIDDNYALISGRDVRHISGPLRMRPGDDIHVRIDGQGWCGRILSQDSTGIRVELREHEELRCRGEASVHLGICLIEPKDMDTVIRYAADLGVRDIYPLISSRANIRGISVKRFERWNDIILESVKQTQRMDIPVVREVLPLAEFASGPAAAWGERLVGVQDAPLSIRQVTAEDVGIVIGPEGGLTQEEVDFLLARGFSPVSMGRTVLRAVTAAITAAAVLGM